jgi:hypothetical protein
MGERFNKTGTAITMSCYTCSTRTLVYDESLRRWHCFGCHASLTTDEAVNIIARNLGEEHEESNRDQSPRHRFASSEARHRRRAFPVRAIASG